MNSKNIGVSGDLRVNRNKNQKLEWPKKKTAREKHCRETILQNVLQAKVLITYVLDSLFRDVCIMIVNSLERGRWCLLPQWRTSYCPI